MEGPNTSKLKILSYKYVLYTRTTPERARPYPPRNSFPNITYPTLFELKIQYTVSIHNLIKLMETHVPLQFSR